MHPAWHVPDCPGLPVEAEGRQDIARAPTGLSFCLSAPTLHFTKDLRGAQPLISSSTPRLPPSAMPPPPDSLLTSLPQNSSSPSPPSAGAKSGDCDAGNADITSHYRAQFLPRDTAVLKTLGVKSSLPLSGAPNASLLRGLPTTKVMVLAGGTFRR